MYDPEKVAAAFQRLFRTYPQFQVGDADEALRVYFEAVGQYETRDIETAVSNFLAGSAPGHNPAFAPPAPQLAAEVRRVRNIRLDSEERARKFRPALPPPDIEKTPEQRARAKAKLDALLEDMADHGRLDRGGDSHGRPTPGAEYFEPDATDARKLRRLGYSVGDPEGDAA